MYMKTLLHNRGQVRCIHILQIALTLQIQSGKCYALGEFKLWSMCITIVQAQP